MSIAVRGFRGVLLTLALVGGQSAICAGWMATPEARMACCVGASCPMHDHAPDHEAHAVTQADADRCCALSEHDDSPRSPASAASVIAPMPVLNPVAPLFAALHVLAEWPPAAPIPASHVPKHVLLSVFLV